MNITVIGAGIWGCWSAYLLQQAGAQVTLVDMWGPGNARAGSGGTSRIIRLVYGADEIYVDMTQRSYELWEELEASIYETIYQETGVLWMFGGSDTSYLEASRSRIAHHGYAIQDLTLASAKERFPAISFEGIQHVYLEEKAGYLYANQCCEILAREFQQIGGTFLIGEATWDPDKGHFQVNGQALHSDQYVCACGPWNRKIFPNWLGPYTHTSRHEVYYLAVPNNQVQLYASLPCWFEYRADSPMFYGKPFQFNKGFKIAYDERSTSFDPDRSSRATTPKLLERSQAYLAKRFPGLAGRPLVEQRVCQYENSLDGHFIMSQHPDYPHLTLVGGSSGHGFKVGPAVGEMVSEHLLKKKAFPSLFSLDRFHHTSKQGSQFLPDQA